MNRSYYFILTVSTIILASIFAQQTRKLNNTHKRSSTPKIIKEKYQKLKKSEFFNESKYSKTSIALYHALMSGDKHYLDQDTRKTFMQMGLMHLLTPSGLHLSSLIFVIKIIPPQWQLIFLLIINTGFFFLDDYFAIKRVIIFKIISLLLSMLASIKVKNQNQCAFLITFFIDIIIGNFAEGPLSYIYSFLFWGTILFHSGSIFQLSYKLFINLSLTSLISGQMISPASLFLNTPISFLFTLIYPVLFFNFWLPITSFQTSFSLKIIQLFNDLIHYAVKIAPVFGPSILFIIFLFIIPIKIPTKKLIITLLGLSLCTTMPRMKASISNSKYIWSSIKGNRCKQILREYYYEVKCKKGV